LFSTDPPNPLSIFTENVPVDQPGKLRDDYVPGDIGFDPLGLKPTDPASMWLMQTKELQNGRLAMLAAAGFMAQELVNGKGILENLLQQG
jgi:Chlorophyll A-B binding protein